MLGIRRARHAHGVRAFFRRSAGVLAIAAVSVALSACSTGVPENPTGALAVVASTTQVADFTEQVGGDRISLSTLFGAGASAHGFEATAKQMRDLAVADVVVLNGAGLDDSLSAVIERSGFSGLIIDASSNLGLAEAAAARETDDEHEHAQEHEHSGVNPHIWTSPRMAAEMVAAIAAGLSEAAPDDSDVFAANAAAYTQRLDTLDTWAAANIAQVPESQRLFVSSHNSLEYYLDDYGIRYVGSILPSFEDNADPSGAERTQLIRDIKDSGATVIFVESSTNPKLAKAIAAEAGVRVLTDDVLFVDSLGAPGSNADNFIAATIHNTETIVTAWGFTPLPVPAELSDR